MSKLLKINEVIQIVKCSRSSIYYEINNGDFPKPIKLMKRSVAWLESDINNWVEKKIAESKGESNG